MTDDTYSIATILPPSCAGTAGHGIMIAAQPLYYGYTDIVLLPAAPEPQDMI